MAAEPLSEAPAELRARLVSAMRWTLWLSILGVPFSYGVAVVLARTSPEAIGTYGLLSVYIGLVETVLYLGGSAVVIRFVPEIEVSKRSSFLASYFVVVCAAAFPYQVAASLWPNELHYLFGRSGGTPFQVLVLWLAPLYMLYSLALAGLRGLLDIKWAKALDRLLAVGSFCVYATIFLISRRFLAVHYAGLVWSVYLTLTAIAATVGLRRFLRLSPPQIPWRGLQFFLPPGFWRYTLGLQASSLLGVVSGRLDYIFLLNAGGLALLGKYVALVTIISAGPKITAFILDSLFPNLSNTLALGDMRSSRQLAETYIRMILPAGLAMACFISLFASPIARTLGPVYWSLVPLIRIAAPFGTLVELNWFLDTVLNAAGRSQYVATAKVLRVVGFIILFWPLWSRFHLLGAVLATVLTNIIHQCAVLLFLRRKVSLRVPLAKMYRPFGFILLLLALAAGGLGNVPWAASLGLWLGAVPLFLFMAGYTLGEIRKLIWLILPVRIG